MRMYHINHGAYDLGSIVVLYDDHIWTVGKEFYFQTVHSDHTIWRDRTPDFILFKSKSGL